MPSYLCLLDEVAHNNGGGELGQRFRFRFFSFFAMEIVSGGIQGEFAQQERVLHRRPGL